ncbi:STAS domain-containing protein [Mycolicibacterium sp. XJ870]
MIKLPGSPGVGSAHANTARYTMHQGRTGSLLSVAGGIDAAGADQLVARVHHAMRCEWLVLDLTAVEFMHPAGMQTLHAINARCARFNVRWSLVAGPAISRLLRSCDLIDLPISESLTAALASVQRRPDQQETMVC